MTHNLSSCYHTGMLIEVSDWNKEMFRLVYACEAVYGYGNVVSVQNFVRFYEYEAGFKLYSYASLSFQLKSNLFNNLNLLSCTPLERDVLFFLRNILGCRISWRRLSYGGNEMPFRRFEDAFTGFDLFDVHIFIVKTEYHLRNKFFWDEKFQMLLTSSKVDGNNNPSINRMGSWVRIPNLLGWSEISFGLRAVGEIWSFRIELNHATVYSNESKRLRLRDE